jgi:hypothetical protein
MNADVMVVTCAEPDALPFLLSLPPADLAQATLVATGDVVRAAERQTQVATTAIIGGLGSIDEVRRLIGSRRRNVAVIVAPDPWGPLHGKGFVRARLLAPWFLSPGAGADLIELRSGGRSSRALPNLTRPALMLRLYAREARLLSEYLVRLGVGRPVGAAAPLASLPCALAGAVLALPAAAITLGRVIPFILWTEARARMETRQR